MKKRILFAALCAIGTANYAYAWGQTGHRVTGAIAEQYLTDDAKAAIARILPNESVAEASTYADEMRSNPDHFWQKVAGPFHYVTVPEGKNYVEVGAPEQGDSYSALTDFTKTLKDPKASMADKQLALRFAIHIIGDLHQPLHAGNGTDRGGNDVKVQFFGDDSNLHRVWDSGLIDRRGLSFTEWSQWLGSKISEQQAEEWMTTDPLIYIEESTRIRDEIYPEGERLSWDYLYNHIPMVKLRLQQGGVRIAAYLNEVFASE
ncbi:S1/P1 nuclease [Glaciecola siphonariae]|uniref:S1/P1 nuclease n=1 Tax=Glaciecola siphonariae TaxID=521012 RepID=A0ABV9LY58_9ALTE